MQSKKMKRKSGQTMVEYIIIVVIIAVAAIAIFGVFGDTIRDKMGGAIEELGGDAGDATGTDSADFLKELGSDG
jgi:Flp pilus assembly pilin Flp